MQAEIKNATRSYKIIVKFFKSIGLYEEFKAYDEYALSNGMNRFNPSNDRNPFLQMGESAITYFIDKKQKKSSRDKLFKVFQYWLRFKYIELFEKYKDHVQESCFNMYSLEQFNRIFKESEFRSCGRTITIKNMYYTGK